jgi:dTDP-4-dehydrorhamnose 3,5-epimerase
LECGGGLDAAFVFLLAKKSGGKAAALQGAKKSGGKAAALQRNALVRPGAVGYHPTTPRAAAGGGGPQRLPGAGHGPSRKRIMKWTRTDLPEVVVIEPRVFKDDRGFFFESFQARAYAQAGVPGPLVQDNHSGSRQGVLRGLHYQIRQPQGKLLSVVAGEVFDVAVDLRRSSPTLGRWVGVVLSAQNRRQVWVPPGFAHGFYVLSAWAEVLYKVTDFYCPEAERTLLWDDPEVGVRWPLVNGAPPLLSPKDSRGTPLARAELFP